MIKAAGYPWDRPMTDNIDLTLIMERLNELLAGQRELKTEMAAMSAKLVFLSQNASTRSQFLALAETLSQFDSTLSTLDARVAVIEARTKH